MLAAFQELSGGGDRQKDKTEVIQEDKHFSRGETGLEQWKKLILLNKKVKASQRRRSLIWIWSE